MYNGTDLRIYFDGALSGTVAGTGTINGNTQDITAGTPSADGFPSSRFTGQLSDAAVYPAALSAARVSAHFSAAGVTLLAALTQSSTLTAAGVRGKAGTAALTQTSVLTGAGTTAAPVVQVITSWPAFLEIH